LAVDGDFAESYLAKLSAKKFNFSFSGKGLCRELAGVLSAKY
jgi:hypothetical protein